jgi:hypothetical protein
MASSGTSTYISKPGSSIEGSTLTILKSGATSVLFDAEPSSILLFALE